MSFLIVGDKDCMFPLRAEGLGSEVKVGVSPTELPLRRSLEAPSPYLEVKEFAVAPIDGLGGATGPRDPDDVDLQEGERRQVLIPRGWAGFTLPGYGSQVQGPESERPESESASCVTWDRVLALAEPQLPHQYTGHHNLHLGECAEGEVPSSTKKR